jgi:hypothetical protein
MELLLLTKGEYKMQARKSFVAIFLILTFAASLMMTFPTANAQAAPTLKTYPIIDAVPNPVGVGEEVLVRMGIIQASGDVSYGWTGITVTVTKPDGTSQTLGPFTTDSTGATFTTYIPNQVGTYSLVTNFPQQINPVTFFNTEGGNLILEGTVMLASTSQPLNLVVQQDPLPAYPGHALPTEYWSRPIDPQLREWFRISGNWLARPDNAIALYNDDAPETAHVLWAKAMTTGGLTGGLWGEGQVPSSAETGDAYEGKFANSVVMNGVLYYNVAPQGFAGPTETNGIRAVDLHTGKELWFKNNTFLSFGQILYFNSFNYDGVFDYLWDASGPVWNAYDPFNGEWLYSMTNVPSGARVFGPSGEILIYEIDYANRRLALWNSTAAGQQNLALFDIGSWGRFVHKTTVDGSSPRSYSWNVSIPAGLTAGTSFFTPILKILPDRVMSVDFNQTRVRVWAVSTLPSSRGALLFDKTWAAPSEWLAGSNTIHYVGATDEATDGVIAVWNKELTTHYGFSTETGDFLWQTDSENWLDAYGWGNAEHTWYFAYGKLFSVGVGGIVYAYDLNTGDTVWTYNMTDAYNEPVTGNNWWGWITLIADGKIYVSTVEHSAEMPIPRGGPLICINATDGSEVWRVNGMYRGTRWGGNAVMGDSIYTTMDTYDQRIYAVGKGPTQTTVNANPGVLPQSDGVMITGYVTDISPGTQSDALKMRFPNGVPAVTDEKQSEWMLYVYKQFDRPTNVDGVTVSLDVIDANGNYRNIGTTTADSNGFYSFNWTPDIEGKYTLFATFMGSNAYFASYAQTAFAVTEAAPTTQPTQPAGPSMVDQYFLPAVVGIILTIIIVGAILLFVLRKHP